MRNEFDRVGGMDVAATFHWRNLSTKRLLVATLPLGFDSKLYAIDQGVVVTNPTASGEAPLAEPPESILQPYEPITGGWAKDSDDVSYIDVTLSLKIRLLPQGTLPRSRLFFAMTTRFGFYWGTRPNSPVIGKDYNPKLLWRYLPSRARTAGERRDELQEYLDIGYAHESNGQLVHTPAEYAQELASLKNAEYVNQFIHRGWDYPEITWKKPLPHDVVLYLDGKYFMPYGLLQGRADQYHPWENNSQGKPRRLVDGAEAAIAWPGHNVYVPLNLASPVWFGNPNLTVKYRTGNDSPFKYSTVRAELGAQFFNLPVALWVQRGYMSDLAMYYQRVTSYGLELRFESF